MSRTEWLTIVVSCLAALAAVLAALISAYSARAINRAELQALRIQTLVGRVGERKCQVYRPMIDELNKLITRRMNASVTTDQEGLLDAIAEFSAWIAIYGSDEAVVAFHNYMQATFHAPPTAVLMRLYGEFVLAARRDMGYPDTEVDPVHLLGMRITDIHEHELGRQLLLPFEELCSETDWIPPWRQEWRSE